MDSDEIARNLRKLEDQFEAMCQEHNFTPRLRKLEKALSGPNAKAKPSKAVNE